MKRTTRLLVLGVAVALFVNLQAEAQSFGVAFTKGNLANQEQPPVLVDPNGRCSGEDTSWMWFSEQGPPITPQDSAIPDGDPIEVTHVNFNAKKGKIISLQVTFAKIPDTGARFKTETFPVSITYPPESLPIEPAWDFNAPSVTLYWKRGGSLGEPVGTIGLGWMIWTQLPVCGDGNCDPGEDPCNCQDCGDPPATETNCTDGVDNDCDGLVDCGDEDCGGATEICDDGDDNDCDGLIDLDDPDCCLPDKAACTTSHQCCSNKCRGGACKGDGTGGTLTEPRFLRGDSNADGALNLADPIHTLNYLFLGGPAPSCADAADSDDNGRVEITDPVFTLGWLYLGAGAMSPPGPEVCGPDTTEDALRDCVYDPVNC